MGVAAINIKPLQIKWKGLKWPRTTRQSYSTSRHFVYEDTTFTRRYGNLQLVKLLFEWLSQETLAVAVEKEGKSAKNAKITRLENLALYGIHSHLIFVNQNGGIG